MSSIANKTCDTCKRRYPVDTLTAKTRNVRSGRSTGGSIGRSGVRLSGRDYWRVQTYYVCTSSERCNDPVRYTERIRSEAAQQARLTQQEEERRGFLRPFVTQQGDLTPEFFLKKRATLAARQEAETQYEVARQSAKQLEAGIAQAWEGHRARFKDQLKKAYLENLGAITVSELETLYSVNVPAKHRDALDAALRVDEDAIFASVLEQIPQSSLVFSGEGPSLSLRAASTSQTAKRLIEGHARFGFLSSKSYARVTLLAVLVVAIFIAAKLPSLAASLFVGWLALSLYRWISLLHPGLGRSPSGKQLLSACLRFYEVETQEVDNLLSEQFDDWISQYEAGLLATRLTTSLAERHLRASDSIMQQLVGLEGASRKQRLKLVSG